MPKSYLRITGQPLRRHQTQERRLGFLFATTVFCFVALIAYYFPKTSSLSYQLQRDGVRHWQQIIHPQILARGARLITAANHAADLDYTYELPHDASDQEWQEWLSATLKQNDFRVKYARSPANPDQYAAFLTYRDIALGKITLRSAPRVGEQPVSPVSGVRQLAIIIDDFGNSNNEVVQGFLQLDLPLTISIIPGHPYSRWVAQQAQSNGKEIIIHMPMEPEGEAYQGGEDAYLLKTGMPEAEIVKRIEQALAELPEAHGMNNHMGSRFTSDARMMSMVLQSLKRKGIYFIDSLTSPRSIAYETARALGIPTALRTVFLDNIRHKSEIMAQFERAIAIAQRSGSALAIGHVHPETLQALQAIQPELQQLNIKILFASQIVR